VLLDEAAKETGEEEAWVCADGGNRETVTERRWQGEKRIERKQRQQLPLSGRLAVIMRNKLPL